MNTLDKIKSILAEYAELPAVPITEDASLIEDLGLDSFLIVYFLTEVEDCFGIDIDESEFADITTIGDIMERIKKINKL